MAHVIYGFVGCVEGIKSFSRDETQQKQQQPGAARKPTISYHEYIYDTLGGESR